MRYDVVVYSVGMYKIEFEWFGMTICVFVNSNVRNYYLNCNKIDLFPLVCYLLNSLIHITMGIRSIRFKERHIPDLIYWIEIVVYVASCCDKFNRWVTLVSTGDLWLMRVFVCSFVKCSSTFDFFRYDNNKML